MHLFPALCFLVVLLLQINEIDTSNTDNGVAIKSIVYSTLTLSENIPHPGENRNTTPGHVRPVRQRGNVSAVIIGVLPGHHIGEDLRADGPLSRAARRLPQPVPPGGALQEAPGVRQ